MRNIKGERCWGEIASCEGKPPFCLLNLVGDNVNSLHQEASNCSAVLGLRTQSDNRGNLLFLILSTNKIRVGLAQYLRDCGRLVQEDKNQERLPSPVYDVLSQAYLGPDFAQAQARARLAWIPCCGNHAKVLST